MPCSADTQNVQAQYARKMVQKYQMHCECHPDRCFKGYAGKILTKCKYGFPFKVPQLNEKMVLGFCILVDARKTNLSYLII